MFSNTSIIAAAAVCAVVITAVDYAQSGRGPEISAAEQVNARFPQASEILLPVNFVRTAPAARKEDASSSSTPAAGCSRDHWPYIADECLVSTGAPAKKPVRMITSERRYADASAALAR